MLIAFVVALIIIDIFLAVVYFSLKILYETVYSVTAYNKEVYKK